jgi:hypothetical protein
MIDHPRLGRKARPTSAHAPTWAEQLDELGRRVAHLGRGCRDPETFVAEKLTLAARLRRLAREVRP